MYLSGSNSTATTTLTFSASANAPGGASSLIVTGSVPGYPSRTAGFTLSTQVTTVTSTPTAVLNSGQSVQVPITLSANAPPITTCGVLLSGGTLDTNGSITGVTCSGSGSGSLNVTVTASAQTQHGTYVIALNGGAVQFHVAIADNVPGSPSGEYTVTAGQTATFTIDSPGPDDLYTEGTAVPLLNGGYVRWAYVYNVLPNSLTVTLSPPASVQAGGYTLDVNLCGCFFNTSERGGGNGDICEVVAPIEVEAAPAAVTVMTPSLGPVGASVGVSILGSGFGPNPTVTAPGITVTVVKSTSTEIDTTFAIPVGTKGGNVGVTVGGATGTLNFYVQIPTSLVRQTYPGTPPAGAPNGYGPLETPDGTAANGNVINAAGMVLLMNQCGVYRNLAYVLVDQADPPNVIQGLTLSLTEAFSQFSGTPPAPATQTTSYTLQNCPGGIGSNMCTADIIDIQYLGLSQTCLALNENQAFVQGFSVGIGPNQPANHL